MIYNNFHVYILTWRDLALGIWRSHSCRKGSMVACDTELNIRSNKIMGCIDEREMYISQVWDECLSGKDF